MTCAVCQQMPHESKCPYAVPQVLPLKVGLVGCSKRKQPGPAIPARQLYTSPLFRLSLQHAEKTCEKVFILSGRHHLLDPDQEIEPYDTPLHREQAKRDGWAEHCVHQLMGTFGEGTLLRVIVYAGARYAEPFIRKAKWMPWSIEEPLYGSIGWRLKWLREHLEAS